MTLLFADGFEGYLGGGDRTVLDPIYDYYRVDPEFAGVETSAIIPGRVTGKCAWIYGSLVPTIFNDIYGHQLDVSALSSSTTWILGYAFMAYNVNDVGSTGSVEFRDSAGDAMVTVYVAGGNINVKSGSRNSATKIGFGSARVLSDVWHYLEIKVTFSVTSGAVVVRLDEEIVLSASGVTAPTGSGDTKPTIIMFGGGYRLYYMLTDDVYIADDQGSINNDFLGDIGIRRLDPTSNGTNNDFTPLAGDNFAAVNQDDPDGDTTYVESSTVDHYDLYVIDDAPTGMATINALQVVSTGKSDDGNPKGGRNMVLSSATEGLGPTYALTSSYVPYLSIHETDPNGGAAWTEAGVNAAEIGVEVVS